MAGCGHCAAETWVGVVTPEDSRRGGGRAARWAPPPAGCGPGCAPPAAPNSPPSRGAAGSPLQRIGSFSRHRFRVPCGAPNARSMEQTPKLR